MTNTSETPASALANLFNVAMSIDEAMKGAAFVGTEKEKLAVGCLEVSLEHQAAILRLGTDGVYASMFSLLRPMVEAYVRGSWLFRCASDKGVSDFKKAKLKKFADLLTDIEVAQAGLKMPPIKRLVDGLHDFTHTGVNQVLRRKIAGGKYPDKDLIDAYNMTSAFGLLAALELASLATDHARRVPLVGQCVGVLIPAKA